MPSTELTKLHLAIRGNAQKMYYWRSRCMFEMLCFLLYFCCAATFINTVPRYSVRTFMWPHTKLLTKTLYPFKFNYIYILTFIQYCILLINYKYIKWNYLILV